MMQLPTVSGQRSDCPQKQNGSMQLAADLQVRLCCEVMWCERIHIIWGLRFLGLQSVLVIILLLWCFLFFCLCLTEVCIYSLGICAACAGKKYPWGNKYEKKRMNIWQVRLTGVVTEFINNTLPVLFHRCGHVQVQLCTWLPLLPLAFSISDAFPGCRITSLALGSWRPQWLQWKLGSGSLKICNLASPLLHDWGPATLLWVFCDSQCVHLDDDHWHISETLLAPSFPMKHDNWALHSLH